MTQHVSKIKLCAILLRSKIRLNMTSLSMFLLNSIAELPIGYEMTFVEGLMMASELSTNFALIFYYKSADIDQPHPKRFNTIEGHT